MDHKSRVTANLQDEYDKHYRSDYMDTDRFSRWARRDLGKQQVHETLDMIGIEPARILDYGCGVGGWIELLDLRYPSSEVHGVDISSVAIGKAKQRFPKHHFHTFEGDQTPLSDESFDLIFSYHVLEHVENIDRSIADICRLLKEGGRACIIFPCGNPCSFQHRIMKLLKGGIEDNDEGRTVFFFERNHGHLRRMSSGETIEIFRRTGVEILNESYSGQFFGSLNWLCRSVGQPYLRRIFLERPPINFWSGVKIWFAHGVIAAINRLIAWRKLDLSKRRNPAKQIAVVLVKGAAVVLDKTILALAALEWRLFKVRKSGAAQYLVLGKQ